MSEPAVAMLLLPDKKSINNEDLVCSLHQCCSAFSGNILAENSVKNGGVLVQIGSSVVIILPRDEPTPPGTLHNAVKNNPSWLSAATELDAHRAHLIVAN